MARNTGACTNSCNPKISIGSLPNVGNSPGPLSMSPGGETELDKTDLPTTTMFILPIEKERGRGGDERERAIERGVKYSPVGKVVKSQICTVARLLRLPNFHEAGFPPSVNGHSRRIVSESESND